MEDENEFLKLSIEDRCQHKSWKARVSGYDEAIKLFDQQTDEKSSEFQKFLGLVKKFVTDSNAVAQEKGIAAALSFVTNAACAGKTCSEVISAIINKGLAAPKAKTKELSLELVLMYIEIEKQDIVVEELIKGLENKSPKVVAACVGALCEALHLFGSKVILIKPLVKVLSKLLEDRDKVVREEAKRLSVEIYRWVGEAIKPQFQNLKQAMLTELEKEFEKAQGERSVPSRYLRSQQEKIAAAGASGDAEGQHSENQVCDAPVEIDPFELMTAVDILSKLPKDFYTQCEAKKWQDRKEALESLQLLSTNVKLEAGDYGELIRTLKKMIAKDTNVVVVALACKCLTNLVIGLKKKITPYYGQCVPVLLEKFKEKKQSVVQVLREAMDAIYAIAPLDALLEDIQAALANKNPQIRAETTAFLARCFTKCTPSQLNKKILKPLCASLVKAINDTDVAVRDNSAEALGTAFKVVGEKTIGPFLQDVDAIKMGKIKDCCEKAVITVVPRVADGGKSEKSSPSVSECSAPIAPTKTLPTKSIAVPKKSASQPLKTKITAPRTGKPLVSKRGGGDGVQESQFTERELSPEEVVEQASLLLPEEVINGLNCSSWKERLAAVEKFSAAVQQANKNDIPSQALVKLLSKKPGFKENNTQILKLRFEVLSYIADNALVSMHTVEFCLPDVVDKLGDPKNGPSAGAALTSLASATSLQYLSLEVLNLAFAQKNPRNQVEALLWLSTAVKLFGLKIQVKETIGHLKKAFASTNPAVKTAALTLVGTLYMYLGKPLRSFFEDEKPTLLQQIDAEFEKNSGVMPPLPERGNPKMQDDAKSGAGDGCKAAQVNLLDIYPRTDISGQITSQIITDLSDKDWHQRLDALQKVLAIIAESKCITSNLGDLPLALKPRLTDTNKKLASQALTVCEKLGEALGSNCSKQLRNFSSGILATLGDNKANIRVCGLQCLNVWMDNCPLSALFEGETVVDALKSDNPFLRIELFTWLTEKLPSAATVPASDLSPCLPWLYSCLEDRNADVRKKASECVAPFMIHCGYETMTRSASKLKPASRANVVTQLEKARGCIPEKPGSSKAKQGKTNSASTASGRGSPPSPSGGGADSEEKGKMVRSTSKNKLALKPGTARAKKEEDVDMSPPFVVNNLKDQRLVDEKCLKVLRWNFTSPREEFYVQLKDQMVTANWGRTLVSYCYHNDFKFHIKAIDIFIECLGNNLDGTTANLDLILKWLALRFFDTNPSVLMKALEYLQMLFEVLINQRYKLIEAEASSFIPYLILKIGDPKDTVRKGVKEIIKLISKVYPSSKLFSYIMQGLSCKNARQRAECLEELGAMIELYGMSVCQPSPSAALKEIAKQISDRDNAVRNASLNCIVQAYFIDGEKVMKYVGSLADKDMSLLEERIKRSSKTRSLNKPMNESQIQRISPPMIPVEENERKPMKGANPRPQSKGPITLDLDDIEQIFKSKELDSNKSDSLPTDADDILNLPDIELPPTKMRPPASAVKLLNNSTKAADAVNLVMAQLTAQDIPVVVEAFAQVEELLKQDDKAEALMGSRVDQLLVMGALQYRLAHTKHMADENICKADVIKLYRCVSMALVSLFDHPTLAKKASRDVLRDLIPHLVTVILDSRLNELHEGPQVVRTINVLIIRILQRSNQTNVMSALIKLLHDCVGNMNTNDRFTDLIMKCLWKMTRLIKHYIDQLDVDRILVDLHNFLKSYPSSTWKDRPDTPIRTVKTILYTLVEMLGESILKHLVLIPNKEDSDLYHYLRKLLKMQKEKAKGKESKQCQDENTPEKEIVKKRSSLKLSRSTHDALTEIFKKIGVKEQTNEGLMELYDFRRDHPEADIEPFLQRSSDYFQNYIRKGIKEIEEEKKGVAMSHSLFMSSVTSSPDVVPKYAEHYSFKTEIEKKYLDTVDVDKMQSWHETFPPLPSTSLDTTVMDWAEWLKVVVSRLGLDGSKYDDPEVMNKILGLPHCELTIPEIRKDTENMQRRLEDIKEIVENFRKA